ncbi:class I SAM-dependent methyltransferase [Infirmifilum sp.]|uniref:class I SAM-dependent methyltransferase n=1 Tax=Infirmifilum sp. TaxID=2856575 RepID=UPI003D0E74CC
MNCQKFSLSKAPLPLIRHGIRANVYVDLGCNNVSITAEAARMVGAKNVHRIDVDKDASARAREKNLITHEIDLSTGKIPLNEESADLVTAFEVIEHLANPGNMLREAHRILKRGRHLLITISNHVSWINKIILDLTKT